MPPPRDGRRGPFTSTSSGGLNRVRGAADASAPPAAVDWETGTAAGARRGGSGMVSPPPPSSTRTATAV